MKTKKEVAVFLGEKILVIAERDGSRVVVASAREEAGTKIILHALDAMQWSVEQLKSEYTPLAQMCWYCH